MKIYTYTGPLSGVSLKEYGDIMLHPGCMVELPESHEYTARLIRKGWLTITDAASDQSDDSDLKTEIKKRRK